MTVPLALPISGKSWSSSDLTFDRDVQTMLSNISIIEGEELARNLLVRNLEEDLIFRLKRRAVRNGRSAEAEHRAILRQALSAEVEPSFEELANRMRELTKDRRHTPAEALQREGREKR